MAQALDAEDQSIATSDSAEGRHSTPREETATIQEAIKEPKVPLNVLRVASFDDLYKAIEESLGRHGPVENVVISFLFRKVENRNQVNELIEAPVLCLAFLVFPLSTAFFFSRHFHSAGIVEYLADC